MHMLYNLALILLFSLFNTNIFIDQADIAMDTRDVLTPGTYVSDVVQIIEPEIVDGETVESEISQNYNYTIYIQDDDPETPTLCLEIEGSIWVFHTCNIPDGNECEQYGPICDYVEL